MEKTNIVEIIPDDMPDWMKEAMDSGQLFRAVIDRCHKDTAYPWMMPPLDKWSICGMNHYHVGGEKRLFVAMTKDGKCIKQEGDNTWAIWNNLALLADYTD